MLDSFLDAEHVKKALEVYNSVNSSTNPSPLTQEATPTPCPGIKAKVLPTASNVNEVSMTTLRESEELKKEDEPDRKKGIGQRTMLISMCCKHIFSHYFTFVYLFIVDDRHGLFYHKITYN